MELYPFGQNSNVLDILKGNDLEAKKKLLNVIKPGSAAAFSPVEQEEVIDPTSFLKTSPGMDQDNEDDSDEDSYNYQIAPVIAQNTNPNIPAITEIPEQTLTQATQTRSVSRVPASSERQTPLMFQDSKSILPQDNISVITDNGLLGKAAKVLPQSAGGRFMHLDRYNDIIAKHSTDFDIPTILSKAVIDVESGGNPNIESNTGAVGLGQITKNTAKHLGITDRKDPNQSIYGLTKYLRENLETFNGDLEKALAGYNAGPGAVKIASKLQKEKGGNYLDYIPQAHWALSEAGKANDALKKAGSTQRVGWQDYIYKFDPNLPGNPDWFYQTPNYIQKIKQRAPELFQSGLTFQSTKKFNFRPANQQPNSVSATTIPNSDIPTAASSNPSADVDRQPSSSWEFKNAMLKAQESEGEKDLLQGLTQAGMQAGAAIAGYGITPAKPLGTGSDLQANIKNLAGMVKTDRDLELTDMLNNPNSPAAKMVLSMLEKTYPGISEKFGNLSLQGLKAIGLNAGKIMENQNDLLVKEMALKFKMNKDDEEALKSFRKDMDPNTWSGRQPGAIQFRKFSLGLDALSALKSVKESGDYDNAYAVHKKEIATALAAMLSPTGTPHESVINQLSMDNTLMDLFAKMKTFGFSTPQATNTGEMIQVLEDLLIRQMEVSKKIVQQSQDAVSQAYASKIQRHPEAYNKITDTVNIGAYENLISPGGFKAGIEGEKQSPEQEKVTTGKYKLGDQTLEQKQTRNNDLLELISQKRSKKTGKMIYTYKDASGKEYQVEE